MQIAIAGSTGLVGSALVRSLRAGGHKVRRLVRSESELGTDNVLWSPRNGIRDLHRLEGIDAFVNLAGASGGYVYSAAVSAARPPADYTA